MNDEHHKALAGAVQQAHSCEYPGCSTIVLHGDYCAKHRPLADWAIAEQVRADIEAEGKR